MNKIVLSGNVCKDIQLQTINSNDKNLCYVYNSLAVKDKFKTNGEYKTQFFNFKVWGPNAEYLSKYAVKGSFINISGRLNNGDYTDKYGNKKYITYIIVDELEIGRSPNANKLAQHVSEPFQSEASQTEVVIKNEEDPFADFANEVVVSDDDLPF